MKNFVIRGYEPGDNQPDLVGLGNKINRVKNVIVMFGAAMITLIFFAVGSLVLFMVNKDKKVCTIPVDSTVTELAVSSSRGSKHGSGNTYAPVYEYDYEGEHYRVKSNNYSSPCPFEVGESVQIYIEPGDPEHIYSPKDKTGHIVAYVFLGIGGIGTLVFLFAGSRALIRGKRKNGEEDYINEEIVEYSEEDSTYFNEDNQY